MGKYPHKPALIAVVVLTAASFLVVLPLNNLSASYGHDASIFGNGTIGDISDKYHTEITPKEWSIRHWGAVYNFQIFFILYGISTLFREGIDGYLYYSPMIMPVWLYLAFNASSVFNIVWLLVFGREIMVAALLVIALIPFSLYWCIGFSCYALDKHLSELSEKKLKKEVWIIRFIVQNGLAFYATWVTIITLLNLAIVLIHVSNMTQEKACAVSLVILTLEMILWTILDNFLLDKYVRYLFTPYIVIIIFLAGSIDANYVVGATNSIFSVVLEVVACAALFLKLFIMHWRHKKMPLLIEPTESKNDEIVPLKYHQYKPMLGVKQLLSMDELIRATKSSNLVVCNFFASYCPLCRMIAPKIEALAAEMPNVEFNKIDVGELREVGKAEGVKAMPMFKLYRNGQEFGQFVGADIQKIKDFIDENVANPVQLTPKESSIPTWGVSQLTSTDEFRTAKKSSKLVVCEFFATWCPKCRILAPKIEALAAEMPNVEFVKIDIDDLPELAAEEKISSQPTFKLYRNEVEVGQFVGVDMKKIKDFINEKLTKPTVRRKQNLSQENVTKTIVEVKQDLINEKVKKPAVEIKQITSIAQFRKVKNSSKLVVCDFFATWCGLCRMMAPKIAALAPEMPNVEFVRIDVDELPELAAAENVSNLPAFKLYKYGIEFGEIIGTDIQKIKDLIIEVE